MPEQMSYEEVVDRMAGVRCEVDELIAEYFELHCRASRFEGERLPEQDQIHMTEYITVCAWQAFDEHGHRGGDVRMLLRDGSMPMYVARGIISSAMENINRLQAATVFVPPPEVDDGG